MTKSPVPPSSSPPIGTYLRWYLRDIEKVKAEMKDMKEKVKKKEASGSDLDARIARRFARQ